MLNLLNILLFVGVTNFFSTNTPVTEPVKPATQSEVAAPNTTCRAYDVQVRLAAYYGVTPENVIIAQNLQSFTVNKKGVIENGFLGFQFCGVDCTVIYAKSNIGSFTFKIPCNFYTGAVSTKG